MISRSAKSAFGAALAPALAAAFVALYFAGELFTLGEIGYPLDDSYIHLQFAKQLAAGDGLTFNPGVLSSGSSSPLWTALLSLGYLVPGASLIWPKVLGLLFMIATVAGVRRLLERLGAEPLYQQAGALLIALNPWLLWSALSGMEVLLFASLVLWSTIAAIDDEVHRPDRPSLAAPLLAALGALARPEGLLLLALIFLCRFFRLQRSEEGLPRLVRNSGHGALAALALAVLVIAPLMAFNQWVGGSPFPSTVAAKVGPGEHSFLPNTRYLSTALTVLWDGGGPLLLLAGAGLLALVARAAQGKASLLLPGLYLFGLPLAGAFLSPASGSPQVGNFGRYLFPLFPLLAALGVLGLEQMLKPFRGGLLIGRFRLPIVALTLLVSFLAQGGLAVRGVQRYAQNLKNVADSDVAVARYLAPRLPPGALVATQDIGAIKLMLPDNRILDLAGLINPAILPVLYDTGPVYWEQRIADYLVADKPDFLIAFDRSFPWFINGRIPGFTPIASFKVAQNVTMAGDELVILRTPWCRFPEALPIER